VQVDHENYLLPADAQLQRDMTWCTRHCAEPVLDEVFAGSKIGLACSTVCRNNPFADRMLKAAKQLGKPSNVAVVGLPV